MVNPGDAELLESFYRSDDVDQGVDRSYLVERNAICRQTVDPALRLPQELERPHCSLLDPR
jgi:hypothetical protein